MSFTNPYAKYRQTQVETANHIKMVVMLHDGAIRFLQQGLAAMESGETYQQCQHINKAIAIIDHLGNSLDRKQGGEIAENLARLFPYFHDRVTLGSIQKDPAPIREVIVHLRDLRSAWAQVAEGNAQHPQPALSAERNELSMAA